MNEPPADLELDYALLKLLAEKEQASQRALAQSLGVSIGKINYCLRAVIDRGWVKVNNFRRADNKLAYAYLLTPQGAAAKLQIARKFLVERELEYERLNAEIESLRQELASATSAPAEMKTR